MASWTIVPLPIPTTHFQFQPVNIVVQPDPAHASRPWTIVEVESLIFEGRPIRMRILNTDEWFTSILGPAVKVTRQYVLYSLRYTRQGWPHHLKAIRWFPEPPPPIIVPSQANQQLSGPGVPGDTN